MNLESNNTYEIKDEIGSGGGAIVYKAYHKRLKKDVVIKEMRLEAIDYLSHRGETDILKNLKHSYLPQVLDFDEEKDEKGNIIRVSTVMDFIPGESFQELINKKTKFSQREIIKWAKQLAEAMEYLHKQNPPIIHQDIKPGNVMLTPTRDICLIDFNISSVFQGGKTITKGGSNGYAPPEQYEVKELKTNVKIGKESVSNEEKTEAFTHQPIRIEEQTEVYDRKKGNVNQQTIAFHRNMEKQVIQVEVEKTEDTEYVSSVDERSDIYSFGATIYSLLTAKTPAKSTEVVKPLSEFQLKISDGLLYVVNKCMNKNPKNRFSSATKLRKTLENLNKLDRRYKSFMRKQEGTAIAIILFIALSALLMHFGKLKIEEEIQESYDSYVEEMEMLISQDNYTEFDELYKKAVTLIPEKGEAVYMKLLALYNQQEYEEVIELLENELYSKNTSYGGSKVFGDSFYVAGNAAFELEDYNLAHSYFKSAIENYQGNSNYYRDYAITLARQGNTLEAAEILEEALTKELEEDSIYLTEGEIYFAREMYTEAEECFLNCIQITEDNDIKARSYVMAGKTYENGSEVFEDARSKEIALLEEARILLPMDKNMMTNARLIEAYVEEGNEAGDPFYYEKAIAVLEDEMNLGRRNYNSDNNLALLYRKTGEFQKSEEILLNMLEEYGENYNTYKRLAYLETDFQSLKEIENRDYQLFANYYKKAWSLYEKEQSVGDTEMDYLSTVYEELKQGNWFDEE